MVATTKKKIFLDLSVNHVMTALTTHLLSMSMIEDDEEVTALVKTPEGYQVKVEKE